MRREILAGVLLRGAACRADAPPPTRFLNFDAASGAESLRSGWSSFERTAEGDTYVWAAGREARIVVQEAADRDLLIRFRCWPFWFQGAPAQTIGLALNGTDVETVRLDPDRRAYTVYVPRDLWRPGANELALAFAYAERPHDHGGSADERPLAVAFDWLEIVPPPRPR
jgi:hypothetical protein